MSWRGLLSIVPIALLLLVSALQPVTVALANGIGSIYAADASSDNVYVLDPVTKTAVAVVPVEGRPNSMAFSPDAKAVYVANTQGKALKIIDTISESVANSVTIDGNPSYVALSPNTRHAYVADPSTAQINVVDVSDLQIVTTIPVGGSPGPMAFGTNGHYLYVTNEPLNAIQLIDTVNWRLERSYQMNGVGPRAIAAAPGMDRLYIAAAQTAQLIAINTATGQRETSFNVEPNPSSLAISNNGRFLISTHEQSPWISVVDLNKPSITKLQLPSNATSAVFDPDGQQAYIATPDAKAIAVLDLNSMSLQEPIPVPGHPSVLGMSPLTAAQYAQQSSGPPLTVPAKLPRTGEPSLLTLIIIAIALILTGQTFRILARKRIP